MIPPIRSVIVDDHPAFRSGIVSVLEEEDAFGRVHEARDTESALAVLSSDPKVSVALVDLRLGHDSGGACTEAIRDQFPGVHVIILTTYDGDPDAYRALRAGATGYLLKTSPLDDLIDIMRRVTEGEPQIPAELATELSQLPHRPALTPRETELLRHLGKGKTNKEIASALGVGTESVKSALKSIFKKLEVHDRTQAVIAAMKLGLLSRL